MWGEDCTPDIDILKIAESLQPDTYQVVLCEGCVMSAIGKDSTGRIHLAFPDGEQTDPENSFVRWVTLDEYEDQNFFKQ